MVHIWAIYQVGDGRWENVTSPIGRWEIVIVDEDIGEMGVGTFLVDLPDGRLEMEEFLICKFFIGNLMHA